MRNLFLVFGLVILIGCKKESYDYRDEIAGNYTGITKRHYWFMNEGSTDSIYMDTISVLKSTKDEIQIMPKFLLSNPNSFKINANWDYDWTQGDGIPQVRVQFFPDKDSISYFTQTGGLGGQTSYSFNGNLIKD